MEVLSSYWICRVIPNAGGMESMDAAAQRTPLAAETSGLYPVVSMLFLLLFLVLLGKRLYRQSCHRKMVARMKGCNHPAIHAITYPSATVPLPPVTEKQHKPVPAAAPVIPFPEPYLKRASGADVPGVETPGVDAPGVETFNSEGTRTEDQGVATWASAECSDTKTAAGLGDYTSYSLLDRMDLD